MIHNFASLQKFTQTTMDIMVNWLKLTNKCKTIVEIVTTLLLLFSYRPVAAVVVANFDVIVNEVFFICFKDKLNTFK